MQRFRFILTKIANTQISNDFLYDIGLINKNKKRVNDGGVRVFPSLDDERLRITIDFHPADFSDIFLNYSGIPFVHCINDEKELTEDEMDAVLDMISLWWCEIPKRKCKKDHSDASSVNISARCIALRKAGKDAGFLDTYQATMNQKTAQSIIDAHKKTIKANNRCSYNIICPYI